MVIPKIFPPDIPDSTINNLNNWVKDQFVKLMEDQGEDSQLAKCLPLLEFADPSYVHGFLTAYGTIREAMIRKQTEELEAMFKNA